jgi:vitamin B12 transporter
MILRKTLLQIFPQHLFAGRSGLCLRAFTGLIFLSFAALAHAGIIRGTVTDATGATVKGATVVLMNEEKFVSRTVSTADGSYQFVTGQSGRFELIITAPGFRQLAPPSFYASQAGDVEQNLVMQPEWVHASVVVTATGTPTPQPQTSETTTLLGPIDIGESADLTGVLRMMPGTAVVQTGQLGSQSSLFVRGGDSDANKVLIDGISAGDLGNRFDFGPLSTTGIETAEIYRGTDSNLYGADASSGVVRISSPRGTSSNPVLRASGDGGLFGTMRAEAEVAGARKKIDYFGAYSWLQTSNSILNDQFHVGTAVANLGWQPVSTIQVRGTVRYGVSATGVPNAYTFYGITDQAKESDQDLFLSGSVENQTTMDFHNSVRFGATRKREQLTNFGPVGEYIIYNPDYDEGAYFGDAVTFTGANGYTASGRAIIDYNTGPTHNELVSNRDQLVYNGDYRFTPHITGLIGFQYANERGSEPGSTYYAPVERNNYDYLAAVHGDFKNRFFYTLGGGFEHYSLTGVQTTPHAGVSFYAVRPRRGAFNGTRILFNFGDAVREPTLTDQGDSLYSFLNNNGGQSTIQDLHIGPIAAPTTRTYEGGVEQGLIGDHLIFRVNYFHNQFGKEIEYVGLNLIPALLPNLTPAQQQELEQVLQANYAYELTINSEAFRAQGIETTLESGLGRRVFIRGGYTYLDAVVQRSFTNDDVDLLGPVPTYDGIPIGPYSPLKGARPFRRPPHSGFISASYAGKRWTGITNMAFSSRSDDSTYLEGEDLNGGNSLLLPNRNLDYGFARIDLGGSYQWYPWLQVYGQAQNLLSNQHIAPIGYPSLPFNYRLGLRIRLSKSPAE